MRCRRSVEILHRPSRRDERPVNRKRYPAQPCRLVADAVDVAGVQFHLGQAHDRRRNAVTALDRDGAHPRRHHRIAAPGRVKAADAVEVAPRVHNCRPPPQRRIQSLRSNQDSAVPGRRPPGHIRRHNTFCLDVSHAVCHQPRLVGLRMCRGGNADRLQRASGVVDLRVTKARRHAAQGAHDPIAIFDLRPFRPRLRVESAVGVVGHGYVLTQVPCARSTPAIRRLQASANAGGDDDLAEVEDRRQPVLPREALWVSLLDLGDDPCAEPRRIEADWRKRALPP